LSQPRERQTYVGFKDQRVMTYLAFVMVDGILNSGSS